MKLIANLLFIVVVLSLLYSVYGFYQATQGGLLGALTTGIGVLLISSILWLIFRYLSGNGKNGAVDGVDHNEIQ